MKSTFESLSITSLSDVCDNPAIRAHISDLILYLNTHLNADHLFVASTNRVSSTAKVIAHVEDGKLASCFEYDLKGTPCEDVSDNKVCALSCGAEGRYPEDQLLIDMGIVGYLGVPLHGKNNETIGILVALYKTEVKDIKAHQFLFETFSHYVMASIETLLQTMELEKKSHLLNEVGHIAKAGGWELDIDTGHLYWTDEVYQIYGADKDEKIDKAKAIACYTDEANNIIQEHLQALIENGEEYNLELPFKDMKGSEKWVRTTGKSSYDNKGVMTSVYGAFEDITAEKRLLIQEQEDKEYLQSVLDSLNDAVITIADTGAILSANDAASKIFGYRKSQWLGLDVSELMPEPYASMHAKYLKHYLETGDAKIMGVGRQLPAKRKNGDIFQMELSLSEAKITGKLVFIGVVGDISEKIKAKETIYKLAFNDKNTGLPNRSWFEKEFSDLLVRARMLKHFVCCALVDIDKMATLNLKLGKDIGNRVIKSVASQLLKDFDNECKVYQAGADSFYLVSLNTYTSEEDAKIFSKKMKGALLRDRFVRMKDVNDYDEVSFSSGIITINSIEQSLESVIDLLEYAKDEAKKSAPGGTIHLGLQEQANYARYLEIKDQLKPALTNGEFQVVVQPQYNSDGSYYSAEALLRWQSPSLGFVSPGEFIPIAEETNDIIEIGYWVIEQVCFNLNALQKEGIDTSVSINISGKHITQTDFEQRLFEILDRWQIAPQNIIIELTETSLVSDVELVKQIMTDLGKKGIHFSIDDFGTGYSSLAYLQSMPLSELKIDRAFVDKIESDDEKGRTIVDMIVQMAKTLGVKTVAEGVETQKQMEYLNLKGCDYYQGFLLAKPVPVTQWEEKINDASQNKSLLHEALT